MDYSGIRVVVRFQAKPDKVEEFKKKTADLAAATQKEDGCISYEFMQNRKEPTDLTLLEHWRDKDALAAHAETQHFKTFMAIVPTLVTTEPQISFYKRFA